MILDVDDSASGCHGEQTSEGLVVEAHDGWDEGQPVEETQVATDNQNHLKQNTREHHNIVVDKSHTWKRTWTIPPKVLIGRGRKRRKGATSSTAWFASVSIL